MAEPLVRVEKLSRRIARKPDRAAQAPVPGCHFHPRCPFPFERCRVERPAVQEIAPGRRTAFHLNDNDGQASGGMLTRPAGVAA